MRPLLLPVAAAGLLLALSACAIPQPRSVVQYPQPSTQQLPAQTPPKQQPQPQAAPTQATLSAAQRLALGDWKIRAGLYRTNAIPTFVAYAAEVRLANYASMCRDQLDKLGPFTPGLLRTPDPKLVPATKAYDTATRAYLNACAAKDAGGVRRGDSAMKVAASELNIAYARLFGADPAAYNAPKVF